MCRNRTQSNRLKNKAAACLTCLLTLTLCANPAKAYYSGGTGEPNNPFKISKVADWQDLMTTKTHWDKHFRLTANLDLEGTLLTPIGNSANSFTGAFDGNDYVIRSADIKMPGSSYVALFGIMRPGGHIENLGVEDVTIVGEGYAAGLVGVILGGRIRNCYATGSVDGDYSVGGLVGMNYGSISNSHATTSVSGRNNIGGLAGRSNSGGVISKCYATGSVVGDYDAGGLVGNNWSGIISNCYAIGSVGGGNGVGGLVGANSGSISNCYAAGPVDGNDGVGGLAGGNRGVVGNCYATGAVTGDTEIGGLVGGNSTWAFVSRAYFLHPSDGGGPDNGLGIPLSDSQMRNQGSFIGWDFVGESANGITEIWQIPVGGSYPVLSSFSGYAPSILAGAGTPDNPYLISDAYDLGAVYHYDSAACYRLTADIDLVGITWSVVPISVFFGLFDGDGHVIHNFDVNMPAGDYVGLFGYVGPESDISSIGIEDASISGRAYVGGLVGHNDGGTVSNCYANGSFNGSGGGVGGLVGGSSGTITDCNAIGSATGGGRSVGGLVGSSSGSIRNCYSNVAVIGADHYVGGLLGQNYEGRVAKCYAGGAVNGASYYTGGLVGRNYRGSIANCYATGPVTGIDSVGGLLGHNSGTIANCYAAGPVTGDSDVGGLLGKGDLGISRAYFLHPDDGGGPYNGYGTPLTDTQMRQQSSFGWDFIGESADGTSEIWQMPNGGGYPILSTFHGYIPPVLAGEGTRNNPYLISDHNELGALYYYDPAACYRLTADIDLAGTTWSAPPISIFSGVFHGNGHVIRNLDVNMPDGYYVGLFGYVEYGARISGIGLDGAKIAGERNVGGLAGYNDNGLIRDCYTTGSVTGSGDGVGCLVGWNDTGDIANCYAIGFVSGDKYVGGLVGVASGAIINCYAAGAVTGTSFVGGLMGSDSGLRSGGTSISRAYFLHPDNGGGPDNGLGAPLSDAQMRQQSSFDWDFVGQSIDGTSEIWQMPDAGGYPVLSIFNGYAPPMLAGDGTPSNPYLISDPNEFGALHCYDPVACYRLTADIDLGEITWSVPLFSVFSGVFDGDGHVIRSLDLKMPEAYYVGLFGRLTSGGHIQNIVVEEVEIVGNSHVGGLVGYNEKGAVSNCCVKGSVSGENYVGGLVGRSYNFCDIENSSFVGAVDGNDIVGGLVGYAQAYITNCYATGTVGGSDYVGGLVGSNSASIVNCYAAGTVSGGDYIGGLLGGGYADSVSRAYSLHPDDGGGPDNGFGEVITDIQMRQQGSFVDWDFVGGGDGHEGIWTICEETNYPRFLWQVPLGDIVCPDGVNGLDFAVLAGYWRQTNCAALDDCEGADTDLSGGVDFADVGAVAESWLTGL